MKNDASKIFHDYKNDLSVLLSIIELLTCTNECEISKDQMIKDADETVEKIAVQWKVIKQILSE